MQTKECCKQSYVHKKLGIIKSLSLSKIEHSGKLPSLSPSYRLASNRNNGDQKLRILLLFSCFLECGVMWFGDGRRGSSQGCVLAILIMVVLIFLNLCFYLTLSGLNLLAWKTGKEDNISCLLLNIFLIFLLSS